MTAIIEAPFFLILVWGNEPLSPTPMASESACQAAVAKWEAKGRFWEGSGECVATGFQEQPQ